jgi:hypothetical protein
MRSSWGGWIPTKVAKNKIWWVSGFKEARKKTTEAVRKPRKPRYLYEDISKKTKKYQNSIDKRMYILYI